MVGRQVPFGQVALALVTWVTVAQAADAPRLCRRSFDPGAQSARSTTEWVVNDRFGPRTVEVGEPVALCEAAGIGGEASPDGVEPLVAMPVKDRTSDRPADRTLAVESVFGPMRVRLGRLTRVMAALITGAGGPTSPTSLTCYAATPIHRAVHPRRILVTLGTVSHRLRLGPVTQVCVPAASRSGGEVLCHRVSGRARKAFGDGVARHVCLPVVVDGPPGEPKPAPSLALGIEPTTTTVFVGDKPDLQATATFPDGHVEDWTTRVVWRSSAEAVAVTGTSPGGVFVNTLAPGTTVISAEDPETGARSTPSNGDVTLTVVWPLTKLTIDPPVVTLPMGAFERFTVIGHFADGSTRNLTQNVLYTSSAPSVVAMVNADGDRSRANALAPGVSEIVATDPVSGLSSHVALNDATVRVVDPTALQYLSVRAAGWRYPFPSIRVGEFRHFIAIGYYAGGIDRNLTQDCVWESSAPEIAAATNPPGARSRITGVSPGRAEITCEDPGSGVRAFPVPFGVIDGPPDYISARWNRGPWPALRIGERADLRAVAVYPGGVERFVTKEVVWDSLDPAIVMVGPSPSDDPYVEGVGPGRGYVQATDPTTGVVSNLVAVDSHGALVGLELRSPSASDPTRIPVGLTVWARVLGLFEFGPSRRIFDFTIESSAPDVLAIDGTTYEGVASGLAYLTARHPETGIASVPMQVVVGGALTRVSLSPGTPPVRGLGETETLTATGHWNVGLTENVTQETWYTSSDPSVVVATNMFDNRSLLRMVGAGTATISAVHQGVSSTTTGDDVTITVLPGALERITITPQTSLRLVEGTESFTAIGHYPNGTTINVTRQVTWTSLDPQVAEAPNAAGHKSRVTALAPGTATIIAVHPSGLSSLDTGDVATMTVVQ